MRIEVKVPQLPESVSEATLVNWHKKAGQAVARDENLVDVETDKVVLELPAPGDGLLAEIVKGDGSIVTSNEVIAVIDTEGKGAAAAAAAPKATEPKPAGAPAAQPQAANVTALPAARKMMAEQNVDPAAVEGTGRGGRVTKGDVVAAAASAAAPAPPAAQAPAVPPPVAQGARPEQRVPMSRLRQRVAERLVQSQSTAAILTTFNEVNMQPVIDLRNRYKDRFEKEHGVKLGFMSFFVKAAVHALKKYPLVNAAIDGNDIVYHGYYDIGIAVGSPRGLVVPIMRDADQLSIAEIEKQIADFGKRAQEGKLTVAELTGGTYTISNGGVFGSMLSTPIINPPQSAILGVHATRDRAVVEDGQVVVRPMNYLAQSYDHRIIDGREAVLSLVAIKEALEDPARLLLDLMADAFDVVVIGAGPGGYIAAIRAAQLGFNTACIDDWSRADGKPAPGGTCTNVGCIPSKALLQSSENFEEIGHAFVEHGISVTGAKMDVAKMLARKAKVVAQNNDGIQYLFKKNKVTFFHGKGAFAGKDGEAWKIAVSGAKAAELTAAHVIVATGSKPRALPGVAFDNVRILDNDGALSIAAVPKRLGVVGAGVIGLEMGSVWRRLGAEVTMLEALPSLLPAVDATIAKEAQKLFTRQGLVIHTGVNITAVKVGKSDVKVDYTDADGKAQGATFDNLIVSIGRMPYTGGLGAEAVGLALDERGFITVDDDCRTNLQNVWAIGDAVRGPMLAHKAEEEGVAVAERIAGQKPHVDFDTVPWVIYTSPEIAWVGRTEQQLAAAGVDFRAGQFPFTANGRARALGDTRGLVKILADRKTDRILGVHMIGPMVSELITEGVVAMEFGAASEDLARICHAHPTLSEALKEAALAVDGRTLNL